MGNDEETKRLGGQINATLNELRLAAAEANRLFRDTNEGVEILTADLQPVFDRLGDVLVESEQILIAAKSQLKGDSEQLYQLGSTLQELERAARSIREFFDYMERNPESILRGKPE